MIVLATYCLYSFDKYRSGAISPEDLGAWARVVLVFVVIGVVASIVTQIVFHILLSVALAAKEQVVSGKSDDKKIEKAIASEMVEDEMDKLIELKSLRVGYVVAGIGFMTALLTQVLGFPPAVLLHVMFISFSFGSLLEGMTQIYFYRKGVTNG
jgi:hypothetical protein